MQIRDDYSTPQAPSLHVDAYPEDERADVRFVNERLKEVQRFAENFTLAVGLHEFCMTEYNREVPLTATGVLFSRWSLIPCRDACMSLFHFCKTIEQFPLGKAAIKLRGDVEKGKLAKARRCFRENFPSIENLRVSIAHAGEINDTIEKRAGNVAEHPVFGILGSTDSLINGVFTQTFNGMILEAKLDVQSVRLINEIARQFFSAFAKCPQT